MKVFVTIDGKEVPWEEVPEEVKQAVRENCIEAVEELLDSQIRLILANP